MHRKTKITAVAAGIVWALCAPMANGQLIVGRAVRIQLPPVGTAASTGPRPVPLINADEDMAHYLAKAQELIGKTEYARAIEILQALLNLREQCFVPTPDGRRFVSLGAMATAVTASLPPDGLTLYRHLYDAKAARMLETAVQAGDEAMLRDIIGRYFSTSSGHQALNLLGAMQFDRGDFLQAGRTWSDIGRHHQETRIDRATLLAKIAIAHHFAGETTRAQAVLKELQAKHADAQAPLGGKTQGVAAFTAAILSAPAPVFRSGVAATGGWTSMAGAPDSVAMMSPCRPVLSPRWTQPGRRIKLSENPTVQGLIGPMLRLLPGLQPGFGSSPIRMNQYKTSLVLREGRVEFQARIGNRTQKMVLPSVIHPLVLGTTVICREAGQIVAYDMLTGEILYRSLHLPLYRQPPSSSLNRGYYPRGVQMLPADEGICTLTAGGGLVYAVGLFQPRFQRYTGFRRRSKPMVDSSVLAAFSLKKEGSLAWWTKDSTHELLSACRFLSAPTYSAGRLYVVAKHTQAYYLLCLDAETGRMIWENPPMISQTPVDGRRRYSGYMVSSERGSPPAVANGRVFACTNAGVLAAFEADTGRALWAYQYDSDRNQTASSRFRYGQTTILQGFPANPIVVSRGRLICLPADSKQVLALRADTGEKLWSRDRVGQRHLSAVGTDKVLLSAPNLRLVRSDDGESVDAARLKPIESIHGRPGVTTEAILASGKGRVWYVPLAGGAVMQLGLTDRPDNRGMLGNLVCVGGKLLAANSAGVSAYFTFEEADAELTERIANADAEDRPSLLHQRAMNAFNAGKPGRALPDLLAARDQARRQGLLVLVARAEQGLYRSYIYLANKSPVSTGMLTLLDRADAVAPSRRTKGEIVVRRIKYYRSRRLPARAAGLAQKLVEDFKDVDLADVEIGVQANSFVYDDESTPRFSGYDLGHRLIGELIAADGQSCYAAFDAKAKTALDAAIADRDAEAMVRVSETYRHSRFSPMALLRAAESYYRQALAEPGAERDLLATASRHLSRINLEYPESGLSPSASLGRAMVYRQIRPNIAFLGLSDLRALSPATRVAFAGESGTIAQVLARFTGRVPTRTRSPERTAIAISPPLEQLYRTGGWPVLLRDAAGGAIRSGTSVFFLQNDRLVRFNPAAGSYAEGLIWEAPILTDPAKFYARSFSGVGYTLVSGLTKDGSILALAGRCGAFGIDVKTGKLRWRHPAAGTVFTRLHSMAVGGDQLIIQSRSDGGKGVMTAYDMHTGKQLWRQTISGSQYPWATPPKIAGGLVVSVHGRTTWMASVYDQKRGKLLGTVKLGARKGQAHVTADGLLVTCDGRSIQLIEPMLGMGRPVWKVDVGAGGMDPMILAANDTHVVVSPSAQSPTVELRSLAHHGMIERTFQTKPVDGRLAVPAAARIVADQVLVMTECQPSYARRQALNGRLPTANKPHLQAFDRKTGKLMWMCQASVPGQRQSYVYPMQVGRNHLAVLAKPTSHTQASRAVIINRRTGKIAQVFTVPRPVDVAGVRALVIHRWLGGPVIFNGRVLLETQKGMWVYGKTAN